MQEGIVGGTLGVGIAALLLLFSSCSGPPPSAGEEGTFENDCCGTVELVQGKILLNGQQAAGYTVARDTKGPYILPNTYVGVVLDEGFAVDGTTSAIKLRLDRLPAPTQIVLHEGLSPYVFTRHAPRKMSPG